VLTAQVSAYCLLPAANLRARVAPAHYAGRAASGSWRSRGSAAMPQVLRTADGGAAGSALGAAPWRRGRNKGPKSPKFPKFSLPTHYQRLMPDFRYFLLQSFALFCSLLQSFAVFCNKSEHKKKMSYLRSVEVKQEQTENPIY